MSPRYGLLAVVLCLWACLQPKPASAGAGPAYFRLETPSGLYAQVEDGTTRVGASLVQNTRVSLANGRMSLRPLGGGRFQVELAHSGQCLTAGVASALVEQAPCRSTEHPVGQAWWFKRVIGQRIQMRHDATGECLAPPDVGPSRHHARLQLRPCRPGLGQAMTLRDESGGRVRKQLTRADVRLGGTLSAGGQWGMGALAKAENTREFRTLGGRLYVHELGWAKTTTTDQKAIVKLFPQAPVWESALPASHVSNILGHWTLPHWPNGGAVVTCLNGTMTMPVMRDVKRQTQDMTGRIGPFISPNYLHMPPWDDVKNNELRDALKLGNAVCLDAPPSYYLAREEAYRQHTADSVRWARQRGIRSVAVVFAYTPDLVRDTPRFVKDLERRDARPDVYAGDVYASKDNQPFPLGDEQDSKTLSWVMLQVLKAERENYPF